MRIVKIYRHSIRYVCVKCKRHTTSRIGTQEAKAGRCGGCFHAR